MRRTTLVILAITCILTGCISTPTNDTYTPEAVEVRPDVYVANDASALPFPTSGYDVYVIGEEHGIHEIQQLFLEYMKILHEQIGLRDIIIEESQYAEKMINEYVLGHTETLWTITGYVPEFLQTLRVLNQSLSDNEKIHVHAVDICPHLPTIHEHLQVLQKEIGALADHIQIPPLGEFEKWSRDDTLVLVDTFIEVAESDSIINKLATARASIQCLYFADRAELRIPIREETIARNVEYVLKELNNAPVLALYGDWHAKKHHSMNSHPYESPWAQRLTETGVKICSICAMGLEGARWNSFYRRTSSVHKDPNRILFDDGSTLADILDEVPDYNIVYINLQLEANKSLKVNFDRSTWVLFNQNVPAGEIFDGLVIFREITPTQIES